MECKVFIHPWYEEIFRVVISCRWSDAISFALLIIVDIIVTSLFCKFNNLGEIIVVKVSYLYPVTVIVGRE